MFSTSSYAELRALLRAIVEAKFHDNPEDLDVPHSAILARVALRIRDEVVAEEVRRDGSAQTRWQEWMVLGPERPEWSQAKRFAVVAWRAAWKTWSAEDRRAAAAYLFSPFEASEAGLDAFLLEVDEEMSAGASDPSEPDRS
jgi:hypothetical protein